MALKFFRQARAQAETTVTPPSLVEGLRTLSRQLQTSIDHAIEQAAPLEEGGQILGRILDEGLQAVDGKARILDERLQDIASELREERRRRTESEGRLREIIATLVDEKERLGQGLEAAREATVTLRTEVNRMGRVLFRSFSASQSVIECLKVSQEELRAEVMKRDEQTREVSTLVAEMRDEIRKRMLTGMLPVLDSLDDGIRHGERIATRKNNGRSFLSRSDKPLEEGRAAWLEGIHLVRTRLERILGDEGMQRIESVGKPFDPQLHRAVRSEQDGTVPPNVVIQEERPGFILGGAVIRFSEVVVSK